MGALHAGHASLLRRARTDCDRVVASIFVNPCQFGAPEDLDSYPRTPDEDLAALTAERVDAVFMPSVEAMFGSRGPLTKVLVDPNLTGVLEGLHRPGHFDGVALVVTKLLVACRPHRAYFGQKDTQQCAVVRRLAADLDTGVEIVVCPVIRDRDGLALSSRNVHLSSEERSRALSLPAGLSAAVTAFGGGERHAAALCALAREPMERAGAAIDYVEAVDPNSLRPVDETRPGCQILIAGRIGSTRLIDVIRLGFDAAPLKGVGPDRSQIPGADGLQGRD